MEGRPLNNPHEPSQNWFRSAMRFGTRASSARSSGGALAACGASRKLWSRPRGNLGLSSGRTGCSGNPIFVSRRGPVRRPSDTMEARAPRTGSIRSLARPDSHTNGSAGTGGREDKSCVSMETRVSRREGVPAGSGADTSWGISQGPGHPHHRDAITGMPSPGPPSAPSSAPRPHVPHARSVSRLRPLSRNRPLHSRISARARFRKRIADPWREVVRVIIHDGPRDSSAAGSTLSRARVRARPPGAPAGHHVARRSLVRAERPRVLRGAARRMFIDQQSNPTQLTQSVRQSRSAATRRNAGQRELEPHSGRALAQRTRRSPPAGPHRGRSPPQ
jgi:hypothetical protein